MVGNDINGILADKAVREKLLQSLAENIKRLLAALENGNGKSVNDILAEQAASEEESKIIREVCEDIDDFHSNVQSFREACQANPSLTDGQWLEQQVMGDMETLAQHLEHRGLTEEERRGIVEALRQSLLEEAEAECQLHERETSMIGEEIREADAEEIPEEKRSEQLSHEEVAQ